ncbi:hypothetical protein [Falsiroseomonas sp.]|uniref:hypothetical protein n=1 Tax=Falsiroseomonas sp. TaxID=2870721 RepID=UPI00356343EA
MFAIWDRSFVEPAERSLVLSASEAPVPAGLIMHRALPDDRPSPTRQDRFDPPADSAHRPEAIYCTSPPSQLVVRGTQRLDNLRCQHHFVYRGLEAELRYRREHLPRWRAIRDGAVRLLDSFVLERDEARE